MSKNRREAQVGGGAAPPSSAMVLNAPVGGGGGIKSPADLNRRNADIYQPAPLPARDRLGNMVDSRFPHDREDPLFPKRVGC